MVKRQLTQEAYKIRSDSGIKDNHNPSRGRGRCTHAQKTRIIHCLGRRGVKRPGFDVAGEDNHLPRDEKNKRRTRTQDRAE